jgi:hypothetical protein
VRVFPEGRATDLVDDVELVTSELTANAVNAGCDILGLRLTVHDRWLEVALWDDAAGVPEIRGPRADGTDGRGLLIVQALSVAWGSEPREDGGKAVWSRLAVPPGLLARHSGCRAPTPPAAPLAGPAVDRRLSGPEMHRLEAGPAGRPG